MIQELISTSSPRCLNGNAGFGIVAQTRGMAPNVCLVADSLSGYTHIAVPGSGRNPTVYLHALRRTGGATRHIVSRIADSGNDYSGRSNRIAHHLVIEEGYVRNLPGGPADLATQNIFRLNWNDNPGELPSRDLRFPDVPPKKCLHWEQITGDAGWGGIVAEHTEKGNPINIVFSPEQHKSEHLLALIGEALALLPLSVRWRVTFSTYYMKAQETSTDAIQIRCCLAGSEERQTSGTLVLDLRQRLGAAPVGIYVASARGAVKQPLETPPVVGQTHNVPSAVSVPVNLASGGLKPKKRGRIGLNYSGDVTFETTEEQGWWKRSWWIVAALALCILLIVGGILIYQALNSKSQSEEQSEALRPLIEEQHVAVTLELQDMKKKMEMLENEIAELKNEIKGSRRSLLEPFLQFGREIGQLYRSSGKVR